MAELNTMTKNEHVGEIEREIRIVKEETMATKSGMPYSVLPDTGRYHQGIGDL